MKDVEDPGSNLFLVVGAYTVSKTCRVLRPTMTARKVHYWLDTNLLGAPIRAGRPGIPTLLSFDQVLKIRTLQYLRDELRFSLQKVRGALGWLLHELASEEWHALSFFRSGSEVGVTDGEVSFEIPPGQGILLPPVDALTAHVAMARRDWESRMFAISGFDDLVSNARVLGGSTVIRGTRIETSFVAHLASELPIEEVEKIFAPVPKRALLEAMEFEGVPFAA